MRVRTSSHGFIFNIHPDNMVPSDLFQGFIVIPHRDWATIQLPFANMAYTGYGYVNSQSIEKESLIDASSELVITLGKKLET